MEATTISTKKSKKRAREAAEPQIPSKKHKQDNPANGRAVATEGKKSNKKVKIETPSVSGTRISLDEKHLTKHSPFVQETQSLFIGLAPVAHKFPLEGACAEFLSPLLLTYYPPVNGVVLAYSNPRLSQSPEQGAKAGNAHDRGRIMGKSIDEYGVTYIWLTAEFLLFKPVVGTVLEGYVNLQNQSVLGLLCYNYFNAGIEQARLPKDWKWIEYEGGDDESVVVRPGQSSGHYVDGNGEKVEGKILFKVKDFDATAGSDGGGPGSVNILGTLLTDNEDAKVNGSAR